MTTYIPVGMVMALESNPDGFPPPNRAETMRTKNPDLTRSKLLEAGFQEVYEHGFRSASVDSILARAGVTKGALYHHFPNKVALGYAIVEELIGEFMADGLLTPLKDTDDPIAALQQHGLDILELRCADACSRGCPLNNLAQEMSGKIVLKKNN